MHFCAFSLCSLFVHVSFFCWHFVAFFGVRSEFVFLLYFFDDFFRVRLDFVRFSQVLFLCASFCNFSLFTRCSGPSLIACCPGCPIYQITRFFTASGPDKKITGPGSAFHRARPYIRYMSINVNIFQHHPSRRGTGATRPTLASILYPRK